MCWHKFGFMLRCCKKKVQNIYSSTKKALFNSLTYFKRLTMIEGTGSSFKSFTRTYFLKQSELKCSEHIAVEGLTLVGSA